MRLMSTALISLACVGLAFSQSSTGETKSASGAPKAKSLTMQGKIVSADDATKTLVASNKKGEQTFSVDADAKITKAGKTATLGDLTAGNRVTVVYKEEDGKQVATKISEHAARAAKKPAQG